MTVTGAARAGLQVEFQVGIRTRRLGDGRHRLRSQKAPAKIGVDDHPRGVEHMTQMRPAKTPGMGDKGRHQSRKSQRPHFRDDAGGYCRPLGVQKSFGRVAYKRPGRSGAQVRSRSGKGLQHGVHSRQSAVQFAAHGESPFVAACDSAIPYRCVVQVREPHPMDRGGRVSPLRGFLPSAKEEKLFMKGVYFYGT